MSKWPGSHSDLSWHSLTTQSSQHFLNLEPRKEGTSRASASGLDVTGYACRWLGLGGQGVDGELVRGQLVQVRVRGGQKHAVSSVLEPTHLHQSSQD